MSPKTISVAQSAFLIVALGMGLLFRSLPGDKPSLIFVIASIVATHAAAFAHGRAGGEEPTTKEKIVIGVSFSVCVVIATIGFTLLGVPLLLPQVTVPISMIGVAVFPFVLMKTAWKALAPKTRP